ncbi:unnamed protein product [Calypogeia fissa]
MNGRTWAIDWTLPGWKLELGGPLEGDFGAMGALREKTGSGGDDVLGGATVLGRARDWGVEDLGRGI